MGISVRYLAAALAGLLATPLGAQQVLVVDAAGAGDFTSVAGAVDAANSGDTVLVRPGTYSEFDDVIVDGKSLVIAGDGSPAPRVTNVTIVVSNLGPSQSVQLRGLVVDGLSRVQAQSSAGLLWIEECTLIGVGELQFIAAVPGAPGLSVTDCSAVTVVRSVLQGGDGGDAGISIWDPIEPAAGGPGLFAVNSDVALYDCVLTGGVGGSDGRYFTEGTIGGHGLEAQRSRVVLSGVIAQGGAGGDLCIDAFANACRGGNGLQLEASNVAFLQQSSLIGGVGGELTDGGTAPPGDEQSVTPSDFVIPWSAAARSLQIESPVRESELGTLRYEGEPGDTFGLYLALDPGYVTLPGKQGVFSLGFPFLGPWLIWTVTAPDGVFEVTFPVWDLTSLGLESETVYAQCFVKTDGPTLLCGPTGFTILADGF